jgi:hypothetical protein
MKQAKGPVHPTPEMPEMTGRDGAVDFIAKVNTVDASQDYDHFAHVLGCTLGATCRKKFRNAYLKALFVPVTRRSATKC